MDLRLRTRIAGELTLIEVGGELELHNAPQLRAELGRACQGESPRVLVDLSGLTFIDSTGIGVLVGGLKKAHEGGGTLMLACPTPRIRRVFEITGLLRVLSIFSSRAEAEAALQAFTLVAPVSPTIENESEDSGDIIESADVAGKAAQQGRDHV